MKTVLTWDKPKRKIPVEEWKKISADSAPPGVYTPNMSEEDKLKWKAKLIKGEKPRVEVRKTFHTKRNYAQVLFVFEPFEDEVLTISTNGKFSMSTQDIEDFANMLKEVGLAMLPVIEEMKNEKKNK